MTKGRQRSEAVSKRKKRGRPSLLKDFQPTALPAKIRLVKDRARLSRLREATKELSAWLVDGREIPEELEDELLRFLDLLQRKRDEAMLVELVLEECRDGASLGKGSADSAFARAASRLGESADNIEKKFRKLHPDYPGASIRPQLPNFRTRKLGK